LFVCLAAMNLLKGSRYDLRVDPTMGDGWAETNPMLAEMPVDTPPPVVNPNTGPGDPTTRPPAEPFNLNNPSNFETTFELDEEGTGYYVHERVGGIDVRPPSHISLREYLEWRKNNTVRDHWRDRSLSSNEIDENNPLAPKFATDSKKFRDIFGGGTIEIRPNGTALIDLGAEFNRSENPNLPIRQQRTANFRFDQQIQLNVVGKIGEKLRLNANWDTQATFDFENQLKLEYTGFEDEIIQKIEAGNVSLPLSGSLIQGGQNLFGVKMAMRFGPVTITSIASQQKGKTQTVTAQGGAQVTEFKKRTDEYDLNRHFFLGHFFRNRYEFALKGRPNVNSPITITRVEVWVTNNNNASTVDNRNGLGFVDLGESTQPGNATYPTQNGRIWNSRWLSRPSYPDNGANDLYESIRNDPAYSEKATTSAALSNNLQLQNGVDFIMVENMRKLTPNEFFMHPQLGYISLNSPLQQNQALFVAYEFMLGSRTYQVGDFTQDPGKQANELNSNVLFLKMLKPDQIKPRQDGRPFPTWDLMMKNIYSIGGYGLTRDNFRLSVIFDSRTQAGDIAYLPTGPIKEVPLLQVFGLDTLQNNNQSGPDNFFDFLDRITIVPDKGLIMFPVLEPFGSHLRRKMQGQQEFIDEYVFDTLYTGTQQDAVNYATDKNRYFLKGSYQGSSGAEISLNSLNIAPGSVKVTANGIQLSEGSDYSVDYNIGKVTILNQGILTSGQELKVSFETNTLFGVETKTLVGSRADVVINKDLQFGATILHLNERPLTNKINIGDEPTSNTIWGLDGILKKDSRFLTRMVDKLPLLQTNEVSNVTAQGEFAQLIPGYPKAISVDGEQGIAYVDDFESARNTFDLLGSKSWSLASFPGNNGNNDMFVPSGGYNPALSSGFSRARLAWYSIDPSFFTGNTDEIFDADSLNHYSRMVTPNEVFPNQTNVVGDYVQRTFDLHYLPNQRGMYNYVADANALNPDGTLKNPEDMWAGVQRRTSANTDFEAANFEFIEFFMFDPFEDPDGPGPRGPLNTTGGEFYLNLGGVSEDVLADNVRNFENGLPGDINDTSTVGVSAWGHYPLTTPPNNAFDNDPESRESQDIGLDGLKDGQERVFFKGFLDSLAVAGLSQAAIDTLVSDPSGDNYRFFRGQNLDGMPVLERYLPYNGTEGNTPLGSTQNGIPTQGSTNPDTEDLNLNSTLNTSERYWEYKVNLKPEDMVVGRNYIVDVIPAEIRIRNNTATDTVKWYQFRIPLQSGKSIGDIQDFKAIEFMRMYMKGWSEEAVLRFAKFQIVSTTWRAVRDYLGPENDSILVDPIGTTFEIGTLNIEENGNRQPFPYVLPPNIVRQQQFGSTQVGLLQNEQTMVMKSCNLADGDARGAFKLATYDMRSYKRLKMWIHAENVPGSTQQWQKGDLRAFIRIGSDIKNNYYEYEIPLDPSVPGATDSLAIWANQFDILLADLGAAKAARNDAGWPVNNRFMYEKNPGDPLTHRVFVVGTPKTSDVKSIMIGIRNEADGKGPICAEVWMNELRLVDFDNQSGWAANARVNLKLADFANITASGSIRTPGFGGIDQKVNTRSRETVQQFDVAGTFNMGKFLPKKWGVQLPLYVSYGQRDVNPQFNPLESDVVMANYLETINQTDRDSVLRSLQDHRVNRSISLNNVRKTRVAPPGKGGSGAPSAGGKPSGPKTHLWDIENFTLSMSMNETFGWNSTTTSFRQLNHRASLAYSYNFNPKLIEPFKKAKRKNPITAFNFYPLPKTVSINVAGDRRYEENFIRPAAGDAKIDPTFYKNFALTRDYNLRWDLTKSLSFNYQASNTGRVEEPLGQQDELKLDTMWNNLLSFGREQDKFGVDSIGKDKLINFGRNIRFSQQVGLNYVLPFDKFKLTNWINSTVSYQGAYNWQAAPDNNLSLGNTINNSQNIQGNARLNLDALYNKVGFLKKIMAENKTAAAPPKGPTGPVANKPVAGQDTTKKEDDSFFFIKALGKELVRTILSVKNLDFTYGRNMTTSIAGYMPHTDNFGLDYQYNYLDADSSLRTGPGMAPGIPFILGWNADVWRAFQVGDTSLLDRFAENGWITPNPNLATPYSQTWSEQVTGRTAITLFRDLKIDLNITKNHSRDYSEIFRFDDSPGSEDFIHTNRLLTGQYSISYIFLGTAFEKNEDQSRSYLELQNNARREISSRLAGSNPLYAAFLNNPRVATGILTDAYYNGYYRNSQEVLIPAFLATYGAGSTKRIGLSAFPAIPLPNWNVNFNLLNRLPSLKPKMQALTLKHGYRGTYSVSGFTSNVRFVGDATQGFSDVFFGVAMDAQTGDSVYNIQSQYVIPSVSFNESFAPLAGLNLTLKNGLSGSVDLKTSRNVSLSVGNSQLTETRTKDFAISISYRKDKLEKNIQLFGRSMNLENALNARLDVSLRDSKTRNRRLDFDGDSQFTAGNFMLIIKPSIDYAINNKLNVRFYVEHTRNKPAISTSFPSTYTAVGFQVRFTLAN